MKRRHFDLKDIERYMQNKEYPSEIKDWGQTSNFRRACKNFSIANGELTYKNKRVVILEKKREMEIIRDIHQGVGESEAMASHHGRSCTYDKVAVRFFGTLFAKMWLIPSNLVNAVKSKAI